MKKVLQMVAAGALISAVLLFAAGYAFAKGDLVETQTCPAATPTDFDFEGRHLNIEITSMGTSATSGTFQIWYETASGWVRYHPHADSTDDWQLFFAGTSWSRDMRDGGQDIAATTTRVRIAAYTTGSVQVSVR